MPDLRLARRDYTPGPAVYSPRAKSEPGLTKSDHLIPHKLQKRHQRDRRADGDHGQGPSGLEVSPALQIDVEALPVVGPARAVQGDPVELRITQDRPVIPYLDPLEIADRLEHAIGKPIVTSNQATIWATFRALGIGRVIPGCGALFREPSLVAS